MDSRHKFGIWVIMSKKAHLSIWSFEPHLGSPNWEQPQISVSYSTGQSPPLTHLYWGSWCVNKHVPHCNWASLRHKGRLKHCTTSSFEFCPESVKVCPPSKKKKGFFLSHSQTSFPQERQKRGFSSFTGVSDKTYMTKGDLLSEKDPLCPFLMKE